MDAEGWDATPDGGVSVVINTGTQTKARNDADLRKFEEEEQAVTLLSDDDALRYSNVSDVSRLLRSAYLSNMFDRLKDYEQTDGLKKNTIPQDDPEYQYVSDCCALVLRMEAEKSRAMVFLRAHYSIRFPELAMFFSDSVLYSKVVKVIQNNMDVTSVVEQLDELIPSQLLVVIIACASTTSGRELNEDQLQRVIEACHAMENLEMAKQIFLEYIQSAMPLICPNLCAFLDTGITSQLFALTGSVVKLSIMDPGDLQRLGSNRANSDSGIAVKTTGFLSNSDLVANLPPQLRPKALRYVAAVTLKLARMDANKRAGSKDEGVRERRNVINRMRQWLDPPVVRGAGHNMYDRRGRKRARK